MRTAALILILVVLATLAAGAQCVTACARPTPLCHHSPEKAAKTCDASSVFGERQRVTIVEAPVAAAEAVVPKLEPAAIAPIYADLQQPAPPGDITPLVLLI